MLQRRVRQPRPYLTAIGLLVCLAAVPGVGCRFAEHTWHTAVSEPFHYSVYWQDKISRARFRAAAHEALERERALARAERDDYVHEPFSPAHEMGFIDGFSDYLYAGGTGEPPPLPPRKLWRAEFQNQDGYQAAIDWFHGFKHGTSVARASGLRNLVIIPMSDSVVNSTLPYTYGTTHLPAVMEPSPPNSGAPSTDTKAAQRRDRSTYPLYLTRFPPVQESP